MMYHDMSVSFYEHGTAFVNGSGKVRRGAQAQLGCVQTRRAEPPCMALAPVCMSLPSACLRQCASHP